MKDSCPGGPLPPTPCPSDWRAVLSFPQGFGEQLCEGDASPSHTPGPQQHAHLSGRRLTGFWAVPGESLGLYGDLWTFFSFGIQDSGWNPGSKLFFLPVFWRSRQCADTPA